MTRAIRGILVECDPSIKSIILKIDALASSGHKFVVNDLDDQTLVINADMLGLLKQELDRNLKETQALPDESDMD